jgi:hypothetical protein
LTPAKKPLPSHLPLEQQQKLLLQPESNPTGHVPFENARAYPFDAGATGQSRVNAWWLAEASWLAYWHDAERAGAVLRDSAGLSCDFVATQGAEVYFASCPRFAVAAFRGTQPNDWNDIFDDACYATQAWDAGHVHEGFARRLEKVGADLDALIAALDTGCRVWFTGHSLGGAVATLAAYRHRQVAGGVYTFGSPLVGNERFARAFANELGTRSVRYVNDHDVVTRVPPAPLAFPHGAFTHVDHGRWIAAEGEVSGSPPARLQFVRDIFGRPNALLDVIDLHQLDLANLRVARRQPTLPDGLSDHTPLHYALHCWNDFAAHFTE